VTASGKKLEKRVLDFIVRKFTKTAQ